MKVAFWSNSDEMCPVSANLAAVSVACAINHPYSIITLENRLRRHSLGNAYHRGRKAEQFDEVGANYYEGNGMEGLLRKIYRGEHQSIKLKLYLKEIIQNSLYYIPQSRVIHNEIFDYEFEHCINPLLHMLEESSDLCFIDTASTNNLSTKIILEEADLIVVTLCTTPRVIEDFFLYYSSLVSKAVFIFINYEHHKMLHIKNISKLYHIPIENMITFPTNEFYETAYAEGCVYEFISRNMNCPKDTKNYSFIQAVKKASQIIMKKSAERVKQKELNSCGI